MIPTKIENNDLREINYALPFVVKQYCYAPMTTQKDKSTGKQMLTFLTVNAYLKVLKMVKTVPFR